jgi:phage anti-repressor protein
MNEIIKIGSGNIGGAGISTVNARDLHAALESKQDFSSWMKIQIERARLAENRDFVLLTKKGEQTGRGGHNRVEYHLTLDAGKHVAMMSGTDKGFEVRDYFIECERKAKAVTSSPALPTTFAESLRMLANEVEMKELAIKQRDEAVRTKAYISDTKTATAMATASVAVRKQKQLENELGRGRDFKCAKSISWVREYFIVSKGMWGTIGKRLVLLSIELGYAIQRIEDSKYGQVNTYHVEVIDMFRKRLDADWNMLGKYRRLDTAV